VIWTRPDATSTSWSFSAKFGTQGSGDSNLSGPYSVAVSADSLTAWVADFSNNRISIWTQT
jgi:DNA-binding beta-propeller fold protein YncE